MRSREHPASLLSLTVYALSQAARLAKDQLDGRLAERGLRLRHMAILAMLRDHGPAGQSSLGGRLAIDPSDMTGAVEELVRSDLVRRDVDPADRRRRVLTITGAGERTFEELTSVAEDLADELFSTLPAERRVELHECLLAALESASLPHHAGRAR